MIIFANSYLVHFERHYSNPLGKKISFQPRCVYYLNFKPGYYLYQLIIFGSCWSLHFSAPLRLLGLFVAFAVCWRTRPSPINIFRVCQVVQNGAKKLTRPSPLNYFMFSDREKLEMVSYKYCP